jgi:hypothetical protein
MPNPNDGHGGTAVPRRSRLTRSLYRTAVGPRRRGVVKLPDAGRRLEHGAGTGTPPLPSRGHDAPAPSRSPTPFLPQFLTSCSPDSGCPRPAAPKFPPKSRLSTAAPPATASRVDCRCRQDVVKCRRASSGLVVWWRSISTFRPRV